MSGVGERFVLGLDLDGCVANFLARMREVFSEWEGVPEDDLDPAPSYGFPEWGLDELRYRRLHRYAVTQRALFSTMAPVEGAPQALRRLSAEGVHIRIATHRLFIPYFHEAAASQTVRWLEHHGIPYWDLCLIKEKAAIRADLFVEDSAPNIRQLVDRGTPVICMSNPMNASEVVPADRAEDWVQAEAMIRDRYYAWRLERGLKLPPAPGEPPPDEPVVEPDDLSVRDEVARLL